jgi:16S rRNA C1402 (ribose-2'-O) methylase RsmI
MCLYINDIKNKPKKGEIVFLVKEDNQRKIREDYSQKKKRKTKSLK